MQLSSPNWTDPPREPGAPAPPVQIWRLRLKELDGDPLETLRPLTVSSEHARARRYQFEADRHRHLAGRALVRLALSRRYRCDPRALSLTDGPHGKPHLQEPPEGNPILHFNVAHTADVVVAAFSRTHPVGIDVESQHRDADVDALAQRVLTEAERRRWRTGPEAHRRDMFLHLWTCKEAFLKATGRGLQRALRTIECTFDEDTVVGLNDAEGHSPPSSEASATRWAVRPFSASANAMGAIVRKDHLPSSLGWIDAAEALNRRSHS